MKPYRKANELRTKKEYGKAIEEYTKTITLCPSFIDAYLERGDTYIGLKQDELGESDLLKAIEIDPYYKPKALFVLAALQWRHDKYDEVVKHAQMLLDSDYKSEVVREKCQQLMIQATFAKEAVENPLPFDPKPLPEAINTKNSEYLPSMSADETQIIFSRVLNGQEDFYISEKKDGEWQTAEPILSINTPGNEGAHTVTTGADLIVYTACERREGYGSCDLYYAEKKNDQWTAPKNMGSAVNSSAWDSQPSLSRDGKFLFFTSNRSGGQGGADIYVCKRFEDGVWSKPVNLGDKVNTKFDEASPFLHPDGRTLYFMSKGYPGMGGFDLYKVRQEQPFKWGPVENIGYPINTKGDESTLYVSLDGKTGYYARKEAKDGADHNIYYFEMPESIRPDPVTYVKGTVRDVVTNQPVQANVLLYPSHIPKDETKLRTNSDGTFLLALPIGVDYSLTVDQKGYTFYSDRFEMSSGQSINEPFLLDIPLQKIQAVTTTSSTAGEVVKAKPIILKNVFFETGSADLRSESFIELDKLHQLLAETPSIRIQVNGHTDDVGDDQSNQALSENRAKSVYQYLIDKGIDANRILYKGFGEMQPIAPNETEEGRAQNRRTEFMILN